MASFVVLPVHLTKIRVKGSVKNVMKLLQQQQIRHVLLQERKLHLLLLYHHHNVDLLVNHLESNQVIWNNLLSAAMHSDWFSDARAIFSWQFACTTAIITY